MNQARRRKSPKKKKRSKGGGFSQCFSMLLAGALIGGVGTALWMGTRSGDATQIGSGIRQMMENSKRKEAAGAQPGPAADPAPAEQPAPQTKYDFYTVLPEIETVITEPAVEAPPPKPAQKETAPKKTAKVEERPVRPVRTETKPKRSASFYMLQAGSYSRRSDADRLKAQLAMKGLPSQIQKVTIQGKGNFYRVRLGPFNDQKQLAEMDRRLSREGIRALRLKVSQGG
ncbi:MAG: SPOR domain-containing protein [Pseudomonadota bacterium]|nr:SPOR domain-containing protein [Pseudomonadota bacterium]